MQFSADISHCMQKKKNPKLAIHMSLARANLIYVLLWLLLSEQAVSKVLCTNAWMFWSSSHVDERTNSWLPAVHQCILQMCHPACLKAACSLKLKLTSSKYESNKSHIFIGLNLQPNPLADISTIMDGALILADWLLVPPKHLWTRRQNANGHVPETEVTPTLIRRL